MGHDNEGLGWSREDRGGFNSEAPPPIPVPPPLPPCEAPPPVPPNPRVLVSPGPVRPAAQRGTGVNLGLLSVVCGLLGVVSAFFVVGGVFGVIGFILGLGHMLSRPGKRAWGAAGVLLSAVAVATSLWMASSMLALFGGMDFRSSMAEMMGHGGFNDWVGVEAPECEATALDGTKVRLSDYRGRRVVILVFDGWDLSAIDCAELLKRVRSEHPDTVVLGMSSNREEELKKLNTLAAFPFPIVCSREMDEPYRRFSSGEAFLFIDRQGTIQKVMFGRQEYAGFAAAALSEDYSGPPRTLPAGRLSNAVDANRVFGLEKVWARPVEQVRDMVCGDWNGDGQEELVVLGAYKVEVIDAAGAGVAEWVPPLMATAIEIGRCGDKPLVMAKTRNSIYVYGTDGTFQWNTQAGEDVRDGCFVDADGDGCDEVLAGMGDMQDRLVLYGGDGTQKWSVTDSPMSSFRSQAGLRTGRGQLYLLSTMMMGRVGFYAASGRKGKSFGPGFAIGNDVAVSEMDAAGNVQIAYWTDGGYVLGMNGDGESVWRCPAREGKYEGKTQRVVAGDWDGDGVREWAVPGMREMLIVSAAGKIVCHTGVFDVVPGLLSRPGKPGLFLTGNDTEIAAFAPVEK